jgi:hypothetical protein
MKIFSNTAISLDGRFGMKDFSKAILFSQKGSVAFPSY